MTVLTVWSKIFRSTISDMFSRYIRSKRARSTISSTEEAYPCFTIPQDVMPGRTWWSSD